MTGAGISVSAGIPDFRSPKTGLYANLEKFNLPYPEAIFDLRYFRDYPQAFYMLAKSFLDLDNFDPTPTHLFAKLLEDKGMVLQYMTQNIDNLEEKAGFDMEKICQAHGANNGAQCSRCKRDADREKLVEYMKREEVLYCECKYTFTFFIYVYRLPKDWSNQTKNNFFW